MSQAVTDLTARFGEVEKIVIGRDGKTIARLKRIIERTPGIAANHPRWDPEHDMVRCDSLVRAR